MAKRKTKKRSTKPKSQEPAATKNPAPKGRPRKANRPAILSEMNKTGATAQVMGKKYGVSPWTIYGWRKRKSGRTKSARRTRKPGRPTDTSPSNPTLTPPALRASIRAVLPGMLREEIGRAITSVFGVKVRVIGKAGGRLRRGRAAKK